VRLNIGTKISIISFIAVAATIFSTTAFSIGYFRANYVTAVEQEAAAVGRTIEASLESSLSLGFELNELAGVNERLGYTTSSYADISGVYVSDLLGKVIFHSDPSRIGKEIRYEGGDAESRLDDGSLAKTISVSGRTYHEISINIHKNDSIVGYLKLEIPDEVITRKIMAMTGVYILVSFVALAIAVVVSFGIGKKIARPIVDLDKAAGMMAGGNLSVRAEATTTDEIGDLSKTFNQMAGEIEKNQKKLEQNIVELHDLLELKTEFLHIIDHQLRTPLSVMRGYLEFWRNGQYQKFPPEKQEDIKHKIVTAADQLSSIIHSMIDALEVEGGSIEVRPTEFDLGELIKEIYEVDFADKYNNKGLSYKMDVSAAPKIFSDKRYVMAIVTNLIDNAMKYTPAGEVFLRSYSDGTNAVIELSDTGIGLSEKDVSGLFQKFVRGEMAPKASPTGSGIGLYIVKQLLTAMKGDIQVYSKGRNQGTMFAVKIPIQHENNKNTVR
jgi:signal transduction histidine kinase